MGVKEFAVRYKAELNTVEITPNNTNSCTKFPVPLCTILSPVALQRGRAPFRSARTALRRLSALFRIPTAPLCSAPPGAGGADGTLLTTGSRPSAWVSFKWKIKLRGKKATQEKCILWAQIRNHDTTNHHFVEQDLIKMSKSNKSAPK